MEIKNSISHRYSKWGLEVLSWSFEGEGQDYEAAQFEIHGALVKYRTAKLTPKKLGFFVTFWKRIEGVTCPYTDADDFDFLAVSCTKLDRCGQFVFPKSVLADRGIVASSKQSGKRGMRVYPPWELPTSKQAVATQSWQINYFIEWDLQQMQQSAEGLTELQQLFSGAARPKKDDE